MPGVGTCSLALSVQTPLRFLPLAAVISLASARTAELGLHLSRSGRRGRLSKSAAAAARFRRVCGRRRIIGTYTLSSVAAATATAVHTHFPACVQLLART